MPGPEISVTTLHRDNAERFQPLRRELGVTSFGMNLMVLRPREQGRIHRHERQEEVYVVLEGRLTLKLDGGQERILGPDEVARVAPEIRRQLLNAGTETVVLLALGGSGEHAGRDGEAWASWEDDGPGRPPQEVPLPEDLPAA